MEDQNKAFERLREIVGDERALLVAEAFSGMSIYILKNIIIFERHRKIRQEFRAGVGYEALAERYGYTANYIRKVVSTKNA